MTHEFHEGNACWRQKESHGQAPAGDWLWCKLMDFCKKRGFAPANFNDLFEIVTAARAEQLVKQDAGVLGEDKNDT